MKSNKVIAAFLTLNEMKGKELKPSTLEILHFVQNDISFQIASSLMLLAMTALCCHKRKQCSGRATA